VANPERNIVGYRIYNGATQICQTTQTTANASCGTNAWCMTTTSCVYLPSLLSTSSNLTYSVKALYYDANNNLQEGNPTSVTLTSGTPTPPPPPTLAAGQGVTGQLNGTAIITWTPPASGTPVSLYRIYRDGTSYTSRYDVVSASSCSATCSYHDVNRAEGHSYYITAVGGTTPGANMAESTQVSAGSA
jgi:hypothetical protein